MAFVQSLDFFHHVEKHQATLLKAIPRGEQQNPEVQEVKQEPVTSSQVVAAIDKIVQEVLERLSKDEAPVLLVENRSNWNNIEDIFYENVQLYGSQATVDNIVTDISCMLKVPRRSLHILSTSKGCVAGNLLYIEEDGTKVDCSGSTSGALVPSNVEGVTNLRTVARFILIIEKDATFQRLLDDDFCGKCGPCILITGKGVPDLNTRLFVRKMWDTFQIPIFTLVDADPHGIEIMCIYKYGSVSMSFEAHNLTVPSIAWLGLLPSDIERLHVPAEALIPLSALDQRKLQSLQKRPYLSCQPLWKQELEIMTLMKMKAEIQALTFLSPTFLTSVYLPNKLEYGGWI
ncbi:meiotic recombination protein SPO11 isoform X3 [Hyla sarda]|uniref:meiotic recombination protein SPO11 isoform X3 n=1 Tax=Hyla sarda TaxID=327740 RepID=UPI0024C32570|nr:meiotic recombination protein SPO11 isoform X3 [Hyla sarda]